MRKKKADDEVAPSGGDTRITPAEIQQVEFRLAFRGYNERDVDAFLDRVTEDLSAYIEEARRGGGGSPVAAAVAPAVVVAGTEDAQRAADAILTSAREQAATIIREAEAKAAAISAAGAPAGDTRATVAPFLSTEREFLQSLGTLVQGRAEEVKQMVLALRARAEAASPADAPPSSGEPAARSPASPAARRSVEAPVPAPTTPATEEPVAEEEAFAPIRVPEGAEASEETGEAGEETGQPAQLRRDSGEKSLRELFWGED